MARKRKSNRTKTRTVTKTVYKKRSGSSAPSLNTMVATAFGYGAVREKLSSTIAPYAQRFMGAAGGLAEEVALGAVHYYAAKKVKNKTAKAFFTAGLIVEASRAGAVLGSGVLSPRTQTKNNTVMVV